MFEVLVKLLSGVDSGALELSAVLEALLFVFVVLLVSLVLTELSEIAL